MSERADVVIVGAGIMGLATAYNLARRHGVTRVVVVDKSYLCGGASGRNGGGVRAQFSSEENIRSCRRASRICRGASPRELKINVWFRQGGYLFVVRSRPAGRRSRESAALQQRCGLATQMLTPAEAKRVVPELDVNGVVCGELQPRRRGGLPLALRLGLRLGRRELACAS
jgi:sarcosine oxidase subunit beta